MEVCHRIARDLRVLAENAGPPDYVLFRVEAELQNLLELSETTEIDPIVFNNLNEVVQRLNLEVELAQSSAVGRPSLEVPLEAVESYLLAGLTVREIAHLLGVSERTVYRRMAEHGVRIERLWRDVFGGVLDLFYSCFCNLEREGLLNPDEELHIYALHWSFLPHIQRHLQFFKDGWNHHRLRTEGNQSPLQLWTRNQREGQDPLQVDMGYGIEWEDRYGHHHEGVTVPEVQLQRALTPEELQRLPDPEGSFSNVLNVYTETVAILSEII